MIPVVIFGAGTVGKLAWSCFKRGNAYRVAAFCVDDAVSGSDTFCGLPVVRASRLAHAFPPSACHMFVALGYQKLNAARRVAFEKYAALGYSFASCVSPQALILNDGQIGRNCFIMEGTILQPFSSVGDNCICWSGSMVSHDSKIGDHCFLAAHSVVGGMAGVGEQSFLGMNSIVRDGVRVGKKCLVGAGSLVATDVADNSLIAEKATPIAPYSAEQALRFIAI